MIPELDRIITELSAREHKTLRELAYQAYKAGQRAALSSPAVKRLRECAECGMCSAERCEAKL